MQRELDTHFVVEVALEPRSDSDQEKLGVALQKLAAADPSFRASTDQESGQAVLSAASEPDLERIVGRLIQEEGLHLFCGAPQVAYRETLGRRADIDCTYRKPDRFARVKLVFEPGEPGSGFVFESKMVGDAVPEDYIPGVEKGLVASKDNGLLAGYHQQDDLVLRRI